jgi:hypothetical protein
MCLSRRSGLGPKFSRVLYAVRRCWPPPMSPPTACCTYHRRGLSSRSRYWIPYLTCIYRSCISGGSENLFSEWTGITKLLDPVMRPLDADEVDYNGGVCGLGHRVVEDVMKPTMKKTRVLVVNVWGGGNITEAALISLNPPLLCTPVGWQPIQLALNFMCHMYHKLFSIHCHACLVRICDPVLSAGGRYI